MTKLLTTRRREFVAELKNSGTVRPAAPAAPARGMTDDIKFRMNLMCKRALLIFA